MSEVTIILGEETPEGLAAGVAEQKALAKIEQNRQAPAPSRAPVS